MEMNNIKYISGKPVKDVKSTYTQSLIGVLGRDRVDKLTTLTITKLKENDN